MLTLVGLGLRWISSRVASVARPLAPSLSAVVVGLSYLTATTANADDAGAELQGRWRATSATRNGKPAEDVVGHRLVFGKEKFTIHSKDGSLLYEGTYRVQAKESPSGIDFTQTGKAMKGTIWRGIYKLKDRRLNICDNAPDVRKPRPETFDAPEDSGYILIVFERRKE